MITIPILFRNLTLAAAGTLFWATAALAANAGASADTQTRHEQDSATCRLQ